MNFRPVIKILAILLLVPVGWIVWQIWGGSLPTKTAMVVTPTPEITLVPTPVTEVIPGEDFVPVAESAGERINFKRKDLTGIKVINAKYPQELNTENWRKDETGWTEGQFFREETNYMRWSGNFEIPDNTNEGLYSAEHQMKLVFKEGDMWAETIGNYAVIKARVTWQRDDIWRGQVQEWTTILSQAQIKAAIVKVSEIQQALDELVFARYGGYLGYGRANYHFTGKDPNQLQKTLCETRYCLNGIDMWYNTFWDPVAHRLLVYYRWNENTSNKSGCGYEYKSVYAVVVVDGYKPAVETIYLKESPWKEECVEGN